MTRLTEILRRKGRLLTTEFLPPKAPRLSDLVKRVLQVASVIDCVSVPELKANQGTSPRFRMNPLLTALRVRDLTGVEPIFHLTPRDYNKNAVAGLLLGAAEASLVNVLVISGDRYSDTEERSVSRNVYDYAGTTDLVRGIRELEDEAGLGTSRFCIAVGTDPTVIYNNNREKVENEIAKLAERQDAGAELAQTQPVFDMRYFDFLDLAREHGVTIPILVGLLPLRGKADAVQIERRYGITIPSPVKTLLSDDARETGEALVLDLASSLMERGANCIHVYPRENADFVTRIAKVLSRSS